ncbi:MAG: glycerol-3-phosphate dehydrogenase/oxidase [Desulfobulbaceae bacterium]|nr:MAG: glycerol-3-phosphate dehydrogenase/oxidase [Desulfobulbaceae bacterium]
MKLREKNIELLKTDVFDVLIIGGGMNGAVSAAALAARGAKVALIDSRDYAGFTSQTSSNLIWGGIKYMESYEFGLVNDLCKSRNELLKSFPSTVKEIRFLSTLTKASRVPPWMMLAGTWLYWLFGRGETRTPRMFSPAQIKNTEPLINVEGSIGGVEYSDAYLHDNDARFVFNFVRNAMDHGCVAANYVESSSGFHGSDGCWTSKVKDKIGGEEFEIKSRVIINAAGAFVDRINGVTGVNTEYQHIFSKGIHLVVPRLTRQNRVLAFFADDGRLFFAIPMANRTCIGTTDTPVKDPETAVTDEDREFVLSNINARLDLAEPLTNKDIISERCGVRPLVLKKGQKAKDDFLQMSRKHVVEIVTEMKHISIFGGKLTDCLNVGEEICEEVSKLGISLREVKEKWYGEPSNEVKAQYFKQASSLGLDQVIATDTGEILSDRLWRRYGKQAISMLNAIENDPTQADEMIEGSGIRRCEMSYIAENEMVVKLEDYLKRRSKLEYLVDFEELKQSKGIMAVCEKLFGDDAQARYDEYFNR